MADGIQSVEKATPGPGETGDVTRKYVGNAANTNIVGDGPGTVSHNREFATLTTIQDATWTEADNITAITITVASEAAGTAQLPAAVGVCFDAPSDAIAATWLTGASHLTDDSEMVVVLVNQPRTYYFRNGLLRLDAIRLYGSENLRVLVEAN